MGLSRVQAAEMLGIGVWRLRDLERDGRLVPKGEKGERRKYSTAQVKRYLAEHPRQPAQQKPRPLALPPTKKRRGVLGDGETAAAIFELLKKETKKIQIVIELRVHPDLVDEMALKFQKMREAEDGAARAPCAKCGANAARFCGGCLAA